jgi:hypothetical protein
MVVKTRNPVERKILQQGVVVSTANGLPVDSTVTVEGTNRLLVGDDLVTYNGSQVTVDSKYNLELIKTSPPRYTGQLVFIDGENTLFYIDRNTIDPVNNTFFVYLQQDKVDHPTTVSLESGWIIAEAKLVNRLATTSQTHIDQVVFNGFDLNMQLDGNDKVQVVGPNGDPIKPNPDGSVNVVAEQLELQLDTVVSELQDLNTSSDQLVINTTQTVGELEEVNVNLQVVSETLEDTLVELEEANTTLTQINNALASPLTIVEPVLGAGTEDGSTTSPKFTYVNNVRLQILATHDRGQQIEYADFGTKNQRIVKIDYTSPTFSGIIARKNINYTLVGNRYRRDSITWSIL